MRSGFDDIGGARLGRAAGAALAAALCVLAPAGGAAASEGGLVLLPEWDLLLLLLAVVALLIVPVNKLLFDPIFRVLEERDQKIAGTRKRAETIAAEADASLQRYEQAIAEVRVEAESTRRSALDDARSAHAQRTAAARAEAESEVGRAREALAAELTTARASLRSQSEGLAREIASRVLGRELS